MILRTLGLSHKEFLLADDRITCVVVVVVVIRRKKGGET